MRLEGKVAVIVGAGQSPGEGIGNGRATTLRFAQEGARILAVDRLIASAEETAAMATQGGECVPFAADVTKEETLAAAMEAARARWGRIAERGLVRCPLSRRPRRYGSLPRSRPPRCGLPSRRDRLALFH
jgi:NAD(P)-dependent dehydrogenase (short-subunit alcohol dehydrogenase family)